MLIAAKARAAQGASPSRCCSNMRCAARLYHEVYTPSRVCQYSAFCVVANSRGTSRTSASSARISAESGSGGGPGRNWLPDASTQVRHVPCSGSIGSVPLHRPAPCGTWPDQTWSEPSARAHSMTRAAAAAATACSDGYAGLAGVATRVPSVASNSTGRGRLYAYFKSPGRDHRVCDCDVDQGDGACVARIRKWLPGDLGQRQLDPSVGWRARIPVGDSIHRFRGALANQRAHLAQLGRRLLGGRGRR